MDRSQAIKPGSPRISRLGDKSRSRGIAASRPVDYPLQVRIGFALPQCGALATPEALARAATRAEELGYDSVWVSERLLWPIAPSAPSAPHAASTDGSLPILSQTQLEPLMALAFVAAHTQRVAIGTSVINLPHHQPLRLARMLATLDVLSRGRLRIGLGNGRMLEEFDALGIPRRDRGRRADENMHALRMLFTDTPVEFDGHFVQIPRSIVGLKPVQKPYPPVYMAGSSPSAMRRVARFADGWHPAGPSIAAMTDGFQTIKAMARELGRNAEDLELIVRGTTLVMESSGDSPGDSSGDETRKLFTGTLEQIARDVRSVRDMGADELLLDPQWSPGASSMDRILELMEALWAIARPS